MSKLVIEGEAMPTNCAHCFCHYVDSNGFHCGTKAGAGKKICPDSFYFDNQRPTWCPCKEVKDDV